MSGQVQVAGVLAFRGEVIDKDQVVKLNAKQEFLKSFKLNSNVVVFSRISKDAVAVGVGLGG